MEQAVLFCRVSDIKQNDGYSLAAQEKHGIQYCTEKKFEIIETYSFTETASKSSERKKFSKVLDYLTKTALKSKNAIHLIVEKPDRLSRNFASKEQIQLLVVAGKLKVHYYKDKRIFDKDCSPAEIFTDDIQTAVSKYHSMNLSRESKKGMIEKASQGWLPGRAPYGYINHREASLSGNGRGRSTIIPDPNPLMVKMIQRIYELRAVENMSMLNILKKVREENLIPNGKTLSKTGVEGILDNKFYGGSFDWDEKEYEGKHELIVPREHFRAVHSKNKKMYSRMPTGLLSGFLTCSEPLCGCHILYDPKIKKLRTTGEERTYHYYHCSDGKRYHRENNEKQKNIAEDKLLEKFKAPVNEISISVELAKAISKALKKAHEKTLQAHKRNIEGYKTAIKQTEQEEDKAYELFSSSGIDEATYKRQVKVIRTKKRKFEDLLEEGQAFITTKFYETSDRILELANNAESLWNQGTKEEKLNFLKDVLSNQKLNTSVNSLDEVSIEYDLKKPFKELAKIKKATPKSGFFTSSKEWCPDADLNHGHTDFQSVALPTELSGRY